MSTPLEAGLYAVPVHRSGKVVYDIIEIIVLDDDTRLWRFDGETRARDMASPPHESIDWPQSLLRVKESAALTVKYESCLCRSKR